MSLYGSEEKEFQDWQEGFSRSFVEASLSLMKKDPRSEDLVQIVKPKGIRSDTGTEKFSEESIIWIQKIVYQKFPNCMHFNLSSSNCLKVRELF